MWLNFKLILIFLISILNINCKPFNILVYSPAFATSHMNFMAHLADALTEAGHNVTILVPMSDESLRDRIGVKKTKNVVIIEQDEIMKRNLPAFAESRPQLWLQESSPDLPKDHLQWFLDLIKSTCGLLVRDNSTFAQLKLVNYDIAIFEPLTMCSIGFFEALGIKKTILATSCVQYEFLFDYIGEPHEPSYVPALGSDTIDKMSILERYRNLKFTKLMQHNLVQTFDEETEIYREHLGNELPDWRELVNSASLYFTNSNPYIDFPRPIIQKTVAIGGISVDMERIKSQKLDDQWNQILNQRNRNMLISFGSMIQSAEMPLEWRSNILSVLKTMPNVTFIWKYESDDLLWAHGANNIYFSKWVPQTALLADPRVNAFLTHGGLGSTNELAHCGKPAVMVPVFGDQIRNANMLARHHSAIAVRKEKLNDFKIINDAIHSILYDQSYQKNAENLADLLANQPLSAKELVVKHTEFVAKFGPFPNMDSHARNLNFFQRNLLDIYFLIGFSYFSFAVFIFSIVRFLYSKFSIQIIQKKNKIE